MVRSFLKWAGGKSKVADSLLEIIENQKPLNIRWSVNENERYHEPLLGSGSMYLALLSKNIISKNSKNAFLGDLNHILIITMETVSKKKNHPQIFAPDCSSQYHPVKEVRGLGLIEQLVLNFPIFDPIAREYNCDRG